MSIVWTPGGPYRRVSYEGEAELEKAILRVQRELFGPGRVYIDVKKKIGAKGSIRNVPDGYLLDLSGREPRLFVVENELRAHDPLRHVAVQILEFSLSFEKDPRLVKGILFNAIEDQPDAKQQCEAYAASHGYRNLDHLLERVVYDGKFAALVIIDEVPEQLEQALTERFQFGVDVLELACYEKADGDRVYLFEPFLEDLGEQVHTEKAQASVPRSVDASEIDTIVVPAWDEGFERVFLGENRWHEIRIHGSMRPQIKHIAVYRVAPVSAITHIAPVRSIEPWKDGGKYVVNFAEPAQAIGPIKYERDGRVSHLQNIRYTTRERLKGAKTLDEVW